MNGAVKMSANKAFVTIHQSPLQKLSAMDITGTT
jgi:hypothetical protein